jgi:hypothetical protein
MTFDTDFLRQVIAQDDRAREDFERFQRRRWSEQQPKPQPKQHKMLEPRDDEEESEFMSRCQADGNDESDCAAWWSEYRGAPKAHTAAIATTNSAAWDRWLVSRMEPWIDAVVEGIGDGIADVKARMRGTVESFHHLHANEYRRADERINELAHEVHGLREEIEAMRGAVNKSAVADLPNWRRSRDAA